LTSLILQCYNIIPPAGMGGIIL